MFSIAEKQHIAQVIEDLLREINHPEMDAEDIRFTLHVEGKEPWSWADIVPNRFATRNSNPLAEVWNEVARERLAPEQEG